MAIKISDDGSNSDPPAVNNPRRASFFSDYKNMRSLLSTLILPLPIFWLLAMAGGLFWYYRKRRVARILLIAAGVWLVLITTGLFPKLLIRSLERQYPPMKEVPVALSGAAVHILVLGAGNTQDPRLPAGSQLSQNALARLSEGMRLHEALPGSNLLFSGWSASGQVSQAEVAARAAVALGVDSTAIAFLPEPWNTRTEALAYAEAYGNAHPLILVTSACHMPRAMMHFRNAGLHPVPAPTDFMVKEDALPNGWFWWIVPKATNVERVERAVHEYAGIVWAWMGGD